MQYIVTVRSHREISFELNVKPIDCSPRGFDEGVEISVGGWENNGQWIPLMYVANTIDRIPDRLNINIGAINGSTVKIRGYDVPYHLRSEPEEIFFNLTVCGAAVLRNGIRIRWLQTGAMYLSEESYLRDVVTLNNVFQNSILLNSTNFTLRNSEVPTSSTIDCVRPFNGIIAISTNGAIIFGALCETEDCKIKNRVITASRIATTIPLDTSEYNSKTPTFTEQPTMAITEQATTEQPTMATTEHATTEQPTMATTEQATTEQPTMATTEHATTEQPTMVATEQATTEQPTMATTEQATTEQPTMATTEQATTEQPTMVTTEQATTEQPIMATTEQATTEQPTMATTEQATTEQVTMVTTEQATTEQPIMATTEQVTMATTEPATTEQPTMVTTEQATTEQPTMATMEQATTEQVTIAMANLASAFSNLSKLVRVYIISYS